MATASAAFPSRYGDPSPWRHVDVTLAVTTLMIAVMGVLMVFSSTKGPDTAPTDTSYLKRMGAFMVLGAVAMVVVSLIDYQRVLQMAWPLYGIAVVLLIAVVSPLGQRSKGAQAWFGFGAFQLQPAEFAKLALIIALASLFSYYREDIDLRRLGVLLVVPGAPIVLILKQPDLGMVLIYLVVVMGMFLVGGVKARHLLALTAVGVIGVAGVLNSSVLAQYQKDRLTAFTEPTKDVRNVTYNVNQSQTAIGSGGLLGQGYGKGRQTQLSFVPEQETDFIFTVVGEELGFVGGAALLLLYGAMVWRIWRTAQLSRDRGGQLVCVGVLSFIVFQVFENVGMTMQIMPVTGIPLPLVSYGGSSILTTFIALGLVQNIHMHRFR